MYWTKDAGYRSPSRSSFGGGGVRNRPFPNGGPPPGFAVPTDGHHVPPQPMGPGFPVAGNMPPAPAAVPPAGGGGPFGGMLPRPPPGGLRFGGQPGGFQPAMAGPPRGPFN